MFREFLTKLVYSLVLRLNLNQVFRLEINRPLVLINIILLLLLSKYNIALSYILSVIYILSKGYSLILIQLFPSIYNYLQTVIVLVPSYIGLIPFKELERAHLNTLIVQGKLYVVYYRNQGILVILVMINEGL